MALSWEIWLWLHIFWSKTIIYFIYSVIYYTNYGPGYYSFTEDTKEPFVRLGTPQDQALNLSIEMLISLLNSCTDLLESTDSNHGNSNRFSDTLRQYIPTVKVWLDWMMCHHDLWQASNIRWVMYMYEIYMYIIWAANLYVIQCWVKASHWSHTDRMRIFKST